MQESSELRGRPTVAQGIAFAGIVVALLIYIFRPFDLTQEGAIVTALTVFVVAFWATNVMPPYIAGLIFMILAVLFKVAPPDVVFSGFASSAFWLVFGGLIIGVAINHTGLAQRLGRRLAVRLNRSYPVLIFGMVALGLGLAFLIPSAMGRIVLLLPILLAMTTQFGFEVGSNGHFGVLIAGILGTFLPSFTILSANVPNMVLAGSADAVHGYTVLYAEYLLLHFPIMGLLKALVMAGLIITLFPDKIDPNKTQQQIEILPMSGAEKRLLVFLLVALGLWLTDTLHGISPAWVAMGIALLVILPGIGVLPYKMMNTDIDYTMLFFVAAVISLGDVIAQSQLSTLLADFISHTLPFREGADLLNYLLLVFSASFLNLFGTAATTPALMTPIVDSLTAITGFTLSALIMIQPIGFSLILFPHQAAPFVVGIQLSHLPYGRVVRFNLLIALITATLLVPLDFLWWKLIGWI